MKRKFLFFIMVLAGLFFTSNTQIYAAENLITNGSFDNGLANWENSDPKGLVVLTEKNTNFVRVDANKMGLNYLTYQTVTGLIPGQMYTLKVDSRQFYSDPTTRINADFGLLAPTSDGPVIAPKSVLTTSVFTTQEVSLAANDKGELIVYFLVEPSFSPSYGYADFTNFVLTQQ